MATFADGSSEHSVVGAVKVAQIPFTSFFTFNICSQFSESEDCDEDMNLDEMFWKLCSRNYALEFPAILHQTWHCRAQKSATNQTDARETSAT